MNKKILTQEEIEVIKQNPYVVNVSANQIIYSLEFKKYVIEQAEKGLTSIEIFRQAGFDPNMLGKIRIYNSLKHFKKEAASPEGLHEPRVKSTEARLADFTKTDLEKKHAKTAIRELQDRVIRLEQQIEFLKKTQSLKK